MRADQSWQLNLPNGEQFDASGLLRTVHGDLLTINDRALALYRVKFLDKTNAADLIQVSGCFTSNQLAPFQKEKLGRYDCEGIAQDAQGRIYVCEEANRWILRCNSTNGPVERLKIDWSPVKQYFSSDFNASFEGLALGDGKIFVANERQRGRILVVDLQTLRVVDDFLTQPNGSNARDVNYSDLNWFEGALFVLLRESRCVLKVDPSTHRVLAEYDFREMENDPEVKYYTLYPTGYMEGLAVENDFIWLVTDNNGLGRVRYPWDRRPTLFKCRRPDRAAAK